jgi:hypothetical protein
LDILLDLPALCFGTGSTAAEPLPDPGHHDARGLSELLAEHARTVRSERVSLADIADVLGTRSIGAWLLILALPMVLPVPAPGISVLFGVPLMIISAQLALGGRRAWLPAVILRQSMARKDYVALMVHVQPAVEHFERIVRPRALWLANDWAKIPIGLSCLVLAMIITLPIPLGHVAPGTAICLLALGFMERDGVVIGIGFVAAVLALVIVTLASAGAVNALHHWFIG